MVDRCVALTLSSFRHLLLTFGQPMLLGYIIGLAWQNAEAEKTTFFVMAISAIYLGCMNACCLIVMERPVFDRERMFDLSIRAYVLSKAAVLTVVNAVGMALFLFMQTRSMPLGPGLTRQILMLLILTCTAVTASALGLLISAFARSAHAAVLAVPSLLVPQIVFSEIVLRSHIEKRFPEMMERLTITKWCYSGLTALGSEIDETAVVKALFFLTLQFSVLILLCITKLKMDDV